MATDFSFVGQPPYVAPEGNAVHLSFGGTVIPAAIIDIGAAVSVTADVLLEFVSPALPIDIDLAASVGITSDVAAAHGVAMSEVGAVPIVAALSADHGVNASAVVAVPVVGSMSVTVARYTLQGEVRESGVLVNRRVRAYLRSTGALACEMDTVVGKFNMHTGFSEAEFYITPIDLSDMATDWLPPTANRVISQLAMDAA